MHASLDPEGNQDVGAPTAAFEVRSSEARPKAPRRFARVGQSRAVTPELE